MYCCISVIPYLCDVNVHADVIKRKHFPRYWPFVRGIHRSPVNFPHKGQWCGALMISLICAWINGYVHNRQAGDLRRHRSHYDATVMSCFNNRHHSDCLAVHLGMCTDNVKPAHMWLVNVVGADSLTSHQTGDITVEPWIESESFGHCCTAAK